MWGENAEPPCLGLQASKVCRQASAKFSRLWTNPRDVLEKHVNPIHSKNKMQSSQDTEEGKNLQQDTVMNFTLWISMGTTVLVQVLEWLL